MDSQVESVSVLLVSYKPSEVFLSFEDPSGHLLHDFQLGALHPAELLKNYWKLKASSPTISKQNHRKLCSKKVYFPGCGLDFFCFGPFFSCELFIYNDFYKEILPCMVLCLPEEKCATTCARLVLCLLKCRYKK